MAEKKIIIEPFDPEDVKIGEKVHIANNGKGHIGEIVSLPSKAAPYFQAEYWLHGHKFITPLWSHSGTYTHFKVIGDVVSIRYREDQAKELTDLLGTKE